MSLLLTSIGTTMLYLTKREKYKSGPIREDGFDWYWNHKNQTRFGPIHDMDRFLDREAEVIKIDDVLPRMIGANRAQVYRNHRQLRFWGLIKEGRYVARANKGDPSAA